jgi:2-polyprenyl-6-methoxyphenol hydroxylase-like FAD-dependent oxidoreductase
MRGDLCHILHDATKDKTKYIFGVHVTGFEQLDGTEGVRAHFSDGTEDTYDLLVGADGQNSEIRRLMLAQDGAGDQLVRKGMNYAWFSIPSQDGDTNLYTLYPSPRRRLTATRKDKPETLRIYLIASTKSLSDDHPLQQAHKSGTLEEIKKAWVDHYRDAGWQMERFLQQIDSSEASDFYSCEFVQVNLDTYSQGRVALVGDAATCASPIGGMGTAIALVGAYCFAGEIARHCKLSVDGQTDPTDEPRDGLAAALKAYEETYRPFVTKTQRFLPRLPDIFMPESSWGVWIMTRIISFAMTLRVDKLLSMLAPDVGGWDLPEYPELGTIQVK